MKKYRIISLFFCVIAFSFVISACSFQKNVNVKSVEIIEETVPEFILAGKFDEAGIEALITYDDGTTETIEVNSNLLKDTYQEAINNPGDYELEILLRDKVVKLKVKIVGENLVHTVKFFNGFNELVNIQFVNDGEAAEAPEGNSHLLYGYQFIGWDRKFNEIKENINVYGIYTKITNSNSENINLEDKLLNIVWDMKYTDINSLYLAEETSKRLERTYYHSNNQIDEIVEKTTNQNRSISYQKIYKEKSSDGSIMYYNELYYIQSNEYYKYDFNEEFLSEYDIYQSIKSLIVNADEIQTKIMYSNNQNLYTMFLTIYNDGPEQYVSDVYEIAFDDEKLIYKKQYKDYRLDNDIIERKLDNSSYYFIGLDDEEKLKFPYEMIE